MYRFYSDMYENEIQSEENDEACYTKMLNERRKEPGIPIENVREMLAAQN
jgi:hypothetical protein